MVGQNPHGRIQNLKFHIQQIRILHTVLRSQHAPSFNLSFLYIRQINRHTLSCIARFLILSMYLDAADLTLLAHRIHLKGILSGNRSRYQCPGNDCSKSRQ